MRAGVTYNKRTAARAAERRAKMQELRDQGMDLAAIGRRFGGISRQRVAVILGRKANGNGGA